MVVILVPYFASLILCCNLHCLVLILCSFDFWMKVRYAIILSVAGCILMSRLDDSAVWMTLFALSAVQSILFVITLSIIEGYRGNWKVAFIFGLIASLVFSWRAVGHTFNLYDLGDTDLELWPGYFIGLHEWLASCYRVLSLFTWKQTLMAAYTRGEWCNCIYLSPYIKWVDGDIAFTYRSQSIVHSKK